MIDSVGTATQRDILRNALAKVQPEPTNESTPEPTTKEPDLQLAPPPQPVPTPPITRPAVAQARRIVTGDSIATGIGYNGQRGDENSSAQWGRNPQAQLDYMRGKGSEFYSGADVVLSAGLLNDPSQIQAVKEQIEFLLNSATRSIRLAGGPLSGSYANVNSNLEAIAKEYGIDFIGGYEAGSDGVHPLSYNGYQ